ncbi:Uncharacterised protein [Mycobacteroides abscessus subsp. abscessus]|uniref:hypothetical protein n=1 Tax=Mycobacteroides abscessus TaxID=36809 RepID=UPI0009269C81|nr:hypothetical protein [Mycobacteroides abscessus]SIM06557.1 Uncharacterised protein [Mycobacteroides abscessus subsp. abscessus]SLC77087.1 Uncharacterised protein [Mycobacteroides abscessus subsp. abscessus]
MSDNEINYTPAWKLSEGDRIVGEPIDGTVNSIEKRPYGFTVIVDGKSHYLPQDAHVHVSPPAR